jgi:hypothetical protein
MLPIAFSIPSPLVLSGAITRQLQFLAALKPSLHSYYKDNRLATDWHHNSVAKLAAARD